MEDSLEIVIVIVAEFLLRPRWLVRYMSQGGPGDPVADLQHRIEDHAAVTETGSAGWTLPDLSDLC